MSSPADDPLSLVARGYDEIAERYQAWSGSDRGDERARYAQLLLDRVPKGGRVLELGCGAGSEATVRLAECLDLTGVDISPHSIELAQQRLPTATFVCGDMASLDFPAGSFDAVAAFYSMTHVPRDRHGDLLAGIARWLRPGGVLVATMGADDAAGEIDEDWLGVPMYFSHFGAEANRDMVARAGLRLLQANEETADEDGVGVRFLWIVAEKP